MSPRHLSIFLVLAVISINSIGAPKVKYVGPGYYACMGSMSEYANVDGQYLVLLESESRRQIVREADAMELEAITNGSDL
jgi:hypothetical protein